MPNRGRIKWALISIKYKTKRKVIKGKQLYDNQISKKVEVMIVVNEQTRVLKYKTKIISRICRELGINQDNIHEPEINSVEILKDLGSTNYDVD